MTDKVIKIQCRIAKLVNIFYKIHIKPDYFQLKLGLVFIFNATLIFSLFDLNFVRQNKTTSHHITSSHRAFSQLLQQQFIRFEYTREYNTHSLSLTHTQTQKHTHSHIHTHTYVHTNTHIHTRDF